MRVWFVILQVIIYGSLVYGQYTVWSVASIYSDFNCTGTITAQLSEPISILSEQCTASSSNCELRDENATLFPGVWQKVACSDWAPAVDFSYRMFQANPGDGLCQAFVKGWGFLPQCNRQVLGDGSVVWLKPICYTNETTLQAFYDDQCLSGNSTILWSLPTAPLWARCSRDLVDNQTFYLTTCPTVIANSAAALLPLLLLLFSLLLVSIIN